MPYVRDVTVFNPSSEKNFQLQTLSGDNAHFHASLPKPKVCPAHGWCLFVKTNCIW